MFCHLKNEGISDEHYTLCHKVWHDNRMTTMRDFLVWYNNRDVVPFLDAIDKQLAFYRQQNIDMFKYGISVPGLTLLYLLNDLPQTLSLPYSTRPTRICITSSKTILLADQRLFSIGITTKTSIRYAM